MTLRRASRPLRLELLETRLAPSGTPWLSENFDSTAAGALPAGWSQWKNTDTAAVAVSAATGVGASRSLAINAANSQTAAHAWYNLAAPADVEVTASVYLNSLIPAQVLARGSNLSVANSTYYALALTRGMNVQVLRVVNGATTVLGQLQSMQWFSDQWVKATLHVEGGALKGQVQRVDNNQYLGVTGQWQAGQAWALDLTDTAITGAGQAGVARPGSYTGNLNFDDFAVTDLSPPPAPPTGTPTTISETFDAATVGGLPAGWAQYASDGSAAFRVAAGSALSPANSFAVTASNSGVNARAWLQAVQAADAQVSAAIFVTSLIPAQVLVRGAGLGTATPTYYALSLTRGLNLQLLRVVNGATTVLRQLTSASWFSDRWVRATLDATGTSIRAQLVRTDTGEYLNAAGQWQTGQAWALSATDSAIAQAGLVGLARPGSYTGTINFDDFKVTSLAVAAPPPPQGIFEGFDSTTLGALPSGWSQFASDASSAFRAAAGLALSPANGLAVVANTSPVSARAWLQAAQPADVQVTAAVYLTSLIPAQVLARGAALDTAAPTYYALSLTRGLTVQLLRVVNGVTTVLGQLQSSAWSSDIWVRATLYANGSNLRVQLFRADTSSYLNSGGQWQASQTWALNLTDTAIAQGGYVGLGRPASYSGTVVFDDFAVLPAAGDSTPPSVVILSPSGTATLSGVVAMTADAQDAGSGLARVEFYVDNVLRAVTTASPYRWDFDTTTASNGVHTLTVAAYDVAGNVGRANLTVTTSNNTALTRPVIPQHYTYIRIAQLAYTGGLTFGAVEDALLRNSVDLVVANQQFAQHIHDIAPTTPQAIYTNFSNLYLELLTDWLTYADQHGLDREAAFYHATGATPFSGDSPSSHPVNWFWGVYRGAAIMTDLTARSRGASPGGVGFGAAGESVYVGYTERFREINVNLTTPAAAGWSGVLEYATAVDSAGKPTSWATLTMLANTTAGLTKSGQILFDPPSDWKAASVGGSARLFYVRFRTVSGGTAPVAATLVGRDYVNAAGTTHGTIPGFDFAADANHDGYLSDAEYANRAAGKDARFVYESRAFYPSYGQMRFVANPSSLAYRNWAVDFATRYLAANPFASALFVDNSGGDSPLGGMAVTEPTAAYTTDYAAMLNAVGRAIGPKWIIANTAGGTNANAVIQRVQSYFNEFEIRPLAQNYLQFEGVAGAVAQRAALTSPAPYAILDSLPTGGSPTDPRTQLATLAYYYLVADPATTFLNFFGGYEPSTSWSRHWTAAVNFNVGQPIGTWNVFATGADPLNSAVSYKVYQRNFGNAVVMYKPLSTNANGSQTGSLTSTTTHNLGATYRPLQADGTLGAPVTSITLRNGEGVILVKV